MCPVMPFAKMGKTGWGGVGGAEQAWRGGYRNQKFCFYFVKFEMPFRYLKWRCQISIYTLERGAQGTDLGCKYKFVNYQHIDNHLSQGLDGRTLIESKSDDRDKRTSTKSQDTSAIGF